MIRTAIAALLVCVSASASALDFYEERGGWSIVAGDDGCGMAMTYEGAGETSVMFGKDVDGSLFVSVTNYNWSARKGEKYDVSYSLNGKVYGGGGNPGVENSGKKGFLSGVESTFERDFAAGSSLHIYLGERIIDRLSLSGTAAGVASLNRCVLQLRQELAAEAREKAKWADLPNDPFSKADPILSGASGASSPRPIGNPGSWASSIDYPSAALREGREGVSRFRLAIDSAGLVQSCEIIATSGSPDLDAQTCTLMMRRARFDPGRDDEGREVAGTWESAVSWQTPPAPPPPAARVTCTAGEVCTRN